MATMLSFHTHLLCIKHRNCMKEKEIKCIFDLVVCNYAKKNNKELDLLEKFFFYILHSDCPVSHGEQAPAHLQ